MYCSVIISVYKDVQALEAILWGLSVQTVQNFEVIVTEDGDDPKVADFVTKYRQENHSFPLRHLTQADIGFRKTLAVNRAIAVSKGDYLIFIDGDCIPHPSFVQMHLKHAELSKVCVGRRMHLGPKESLLARAKPDRILKFATWPKLLSSFISLHADSVRNYEIGAPSNWLHKRLSGHHLGIVGCNFSCFKQDMLKINGYDEDLPGAGGEDGDLGWRFEGLGIHTKNIKFQAVVYHLDHPARRHQENVNESISARNKSLGLYVCKNGIQKIQG
jgi:glycosyltransferase involved in cell wall biosynthesis